MVLAAKSGFDTPHIVSVPLAFVFYRLFMLVVGQLLNLPQWIEPMIVGFIVGYVCYDMTHHFPMRWGVLKALKRYHMQHHYKTPNERFGVSTPTWDMAFGTPPDDTPRLNRFRNNTPQNDPQRNAKGHEVVGVSFVFLAYASQPRINPGIYSTQPAIDAAPHRCRELTF